MRQISDITGFLEHPVKGVSAAFAILFTISGGLHIWQSRKYKSWPYTWPLPCACIIFTASFICREYTANHPTSDAGATQGLFYSAVPIITAPLYLFLPRLLATYPSLVPIRPIYLSALPFCLVTVVIALTAQGTSSFFSLDATDASVSSGLALLKASLIIQLFFNAVSIAIIGIFYSRYSSQGISQQSGERRIKIATISLSISIALVLIRNLFSTIQIFLPSDSPAWTAEAYFWVFDAALMLACTVFLHILHPAKYFQVEGDCCAARSATERINDVEVGSESAKR